MFAKKKMFGWMNCKETNKEHEEYKALV
jgi:hypothetical protein